MDFQKATKNIRAELTKYLKESGLKSLVIGMSGGIDSTLCAALAKPVCDELGVTLIGRSLPILTNKPDEIDRARMAGECFCHDFKEVKTLEIPYIDLEERIHFVEEMENSKIAQGNLKARLRMIYLYNVAGMNQGMVLSTDNYTELLLGFWTLHGDVGDYGMIQQLWKTEVYGLAKYLADCLEDDRAKEALRACIAATPTDGLGVSNSDLEQIGARSYEEVDIILMDYVIDGNATFKDHPVIQRYKRSQFKRDNPYNLPRELIVK